MHVVEETFSLPVGYSFLTHVTFFGKPKNYTLEFCSSDKTYIHTYIYKRPA